ncbi:MAG: hypothetical protein AAGI50_16890 [Pseudomonadota bacterium]
MTIEKILIIGLALAGIIAFTNFFNGGAEAVAEQVGTMETNTTTIEGLLNVGW